MIGNLRLSPQITIRASGISVSWKSLIAFLSGSCIHFQTTGAVATVRLLQQTQHSTACYHTDSDVPGSVTEAGKLQRTCHWFCSLSSALSQSQVPLSKAHASDYKAKVCSLKISLSSHWLHFLTNSKKSTKLHHPPKELNLRRRAGKRQSSLANTAVLPGEMNGGADSGSAHIGTWH